VKYIQKNTVVRLTAVFFFFGKKIFTFTISYASMYLVKDGILGSFHREVIQKFLNLPDSTHRNRGRLVQIPGGPRPPMPQDPSIKYFHSGG
jgi:hypothetical protein